MAKDVYEIVLLLSTQLNDMINMLNKVITLESNGMKSIAFDEVNLYISSAQFGTIEGLRDKCLGATSRSSPFIPLNMIQKLTHTDDAEEISVYFLRQNGKQKSYYLEGFNPELAKEFVQEVAKAAGLTGSEESSGKKHDFTKHYITLGGLAIFIPVMIWIAGWPRTGRRTQIIKLLQDIGPAGVSIIGAIILAVVLFQMYRLKRKPANQTVYNRL